MSALNDKTPINVTYNITAKMAQTKLTPRKSQEIRLPHPHKVRLGHPPPCVRQKLPTALDILNRRESTVKSSYQENT